MFDFYTLEATTSLTQGDTASKTTLQNAMQLKAVGGTGDKGALITLGATTEKELSALTGLNGTGAYAPKTTGSTSGYSGLTVIDANGKVIPNATLPSVGGKVVANNGADVLVGNSIPANSTNAGVGLRNDLSIQAGVPTSTSNIWGASLDDLKQAFNTNGATITPGSARASSSGNAQILNVEGSSTGVVQVQYSPASTATTKTSHGGQYYKFTYADGAELKVIDPATYRVLGWPENGGKTTFLNPSGKVITFDPITKTWR